MRLQGVKTELVFLVAAIFGLIFGLVRTKIIASYFPPEVSGQIGFFSTVLALSGTISIFGSWIVGAREVIQGSTRSRPNTGSVSLILIAATTTAIVLAAILATPDRVLESLNIINNLIRREHLIAAVCLAGFANLANIVWRAKGLAWRLLLITSASSLISVSLCWIAASVSDPDLVVWGTVGAFALPALTFLLFEVIPIVGGGVRKNDIRRTVIRILRGGSTGLVSFGTQSIGDLAVRLMIVVVLGSATNGYAQPYYLVVGVLIPQINAVITSRLVGEFLKVENGSEGMAVQKIWCLGLALSTTACLGIAVSSSLVITILFGESFLTGAALLSLGCLAELSRQNSNTLRVYLQTVDANRVVNFSMIVGASAKVLVVSSLLEGYGLQAVAVGAMVEGTFSLVLFLLLRRNIDSQIRRVSFITHLITASLFAVGVIIW